MSTDSGAALACTGDGIFYMATNTEAVEGDPKTILAVLKQKDSKYYSTLLPTDSPDKYDAYLETGVDSLVKDTYAGLTTDNKKHVFALYENAIFKWRSSCKSTTISISIIYCK